MKNKVSKKTELAVTDSLIAVNAHAAGIDIGSTFHVVAIGQLPHQIRQFDVYTEDLEELAQWLLKNNINTVAMESTGTYWKSLFQTLCKHGLEVCLTSGKFTRNVRGRKSDIIDAAARAAPLDSETTHFWSIAVFFSSFRVFRCAKNSYKTSKRYC